MKWMTPQELAGMPGVPGTVSGLIRLAKREGWEGQRRLGSKAIEYNIAVLPPETRQALLAKQVQAVTLEHAETTSESALSVPTKRTRAMRLVPGRDELDHRQRLVRDARQLLVNLVKTITTRTGMNLKRACVHLLDMAAAGELSNAQLLALAIANTKGCLNWAVKLEDGFPVAIPLPGQDLQASACHTSLRSLQRWFAEHKDRGSDALAPGKREADTSIKGWVPYFLAQMQRPQKPSIADSWREMCKTLPAEIKPPSYDAVYRWYTQKYSNLDKRRGRHQGSARNPHEGYITRTSEGMAPMLEVHSDGWGTHFTAPHPESGKYVKLEVWHTHDVATRYVFPPSIGFSESMLVIMECLRNTVAFGGVPAVWQTDNTGSVKNDRVSFDPVTSIQARMGVHIVHNLPGNSQANGICENFNQYLDSRARHLATYMGRDMDSLAAKRVLKLTQKLVKAETREARQALVAEAEKAGAGHLIQSYEEACALICQWVDEYNHRPHSALPKITDPVTGKRRHQTPAEAWQAHVANGWQPIPVSTDELADLFRAHETRRVRRGRVTLYQQDYYHPELEHHNGDEVQVAYDLYDGDRVWVKNLAGRLICEAKVVAARAYRVQSFYEMATGKRLDAAIKRHEGHIDELNRQRPVHTISHEAPLVIPGLGDLTPERLNARFSEALVLEGEAVRLADSSATPVQVAAEAVTPSAAHDFNARIAAMEQLERYRYCRKLNGMLDEGHSVSEDEARFARVYQLSKPYQAFYRAEMEGRL